jgi:lipopolysaccharide biosynthesis glycosyltransferase
VSILSDALYSDSDFVVEAIADLLDTCIEGKTTNCVSENRMTQARYIMEVDEKIFRAITPEDLYRIEAKEMEGLVGELVSAVGLQRFRFGERQFQGKLL